MFCETWYKYRIPIGFLEPCITVVVCKYWLLRHCKRPADSHWPRLTITASWRKHRFKMKASSITGLRITDCGRLSRGNTILATASTVKNVRLCAIIDTTYEIAIGWFDHKLLATILISFTEKKSDLLLMLYSWYTWITTSARSVLASFEPLKHSWKIALKINSARFLKNETK